MCGNDHERLISELQTKSKSLVELFRDFQISLRCACAYEPSVYSAVVFQFSVTHSTTPTDSK